MSLLAGFVLAVVLYRLFIGSLNWHARGVFDTRALVGDESRSRLALWGLAVYALSPASPIFVTGYAEALSTLLLALSVWCVLRGRYVLLLPVALLAALSRPVGVPLGAFVGLWWLWCTVNDYRRRRIEDASPGQHSVGASVSSLVPCWYALSHLRILCMQLFIRDVTMRISQRSWDGVTVSLVMDTNTSFNG